MTSMRGATASSSALACAFCHKSPTASRTRSLRWKRLRRRPPWMARRSRRLRVPSETAAVKEVPAFAGLRSDWRLDPHCATDRRAQRLDLHPHQRRRLPRRLRLPVFADHRPDLPLLFSHRVEEHLGVVGRLPPAARFEFQRRSGERAQRDQRLPHRVLPRATARQHDQWHGDGHRPRHRRARFRPADRTAALRPRPHPLSRDLLLLDSGRDHRLVQGGSWTWIPSDPWWVFPLVVTGIFVVVQQVDGIFITPKIVGESAWACTR